VGTSSGWAGGGGALFLSCVGVSFAEPLSLDGYLDQVRGQGPAYSAAANSVKGLERQKSQADLIYSPQLVAHAVHLDDRSEQVSPSFYGEKTLATDAGVALVKKWKYGLTTSLDYGVTKTQVLGSSLLSDEPSYQVRPSASATLSLWRDFMGRQTRAQMDHVRSLIESAGASAAHQREALIYQARVAYWQLQLARKEVEVRKDTLARAETLVKWSERRVRLDLVDDSEVLQARAARQVRAIELERALEAEKKARVVFNRNRGVEGKEVPELLEGLDAQSAALTFVWQEDAPTSWDVRAARHKIEAEKATWRDAKSNVCPDLNLFASYNSNGLEDGLGAAHRESLKGNRPATKVGASIVIPLDVFTAKKAADGYEMNYQASKDALQDKLLQTRQDWEMLKERLDDVEIRLEMAREIETIQKKKLEAERDQLTVGRSTQFQVQNYETDYALSRLQCLGVQVEKLCLWAEGEWMMAADREQLARRADGRPLANEKNEVSK